MRGPKKTTELLIHPQDFSNVPAKVNSTREDQVTAFGFPTIHLQDDKKNKVLSRKAGNPHENTKNACGDPLIHNKYIENELLISKDNPIQNSIKQYIYDLKNTTKKGAAKPKDEDEDTKEKIKPNDLNRITQTLKKATLQNLAKAPRGQSKEIQKLTQAIEMMNMTEEENWKISALMSAPEDEMSLGVKKQFGDEIIKMPPKAYLLKGEQDKWLDQHQRLSDQQIQS